MKRLFSEPAARTRGFGFPLNRNLSPQTLARRGYPEEEASAQPRPRPTGTRLFIAAAFLALSLFPGVPLNAYYVTYKEQYYRLYHLHHIQYPDDTMENIYWLEKAVKADFCNPLYAMALIEDEVQWEKYRYLFMMHVNIKLAEQYLFLGNKWNKRNAYFYNAPWKEQNLESLETAETCFRTGLYYWQEALSWVEKLKDRKFRYINLARIQFWEDEAGRVEEKTLNYEKTIARELDLLREVREKFRAMNADTY